MFNISTLLGVAAKTTLAGAFTLYQLTEGEAEHFDWKKVALGYAAAIVATAAGYFVFKSAKKVDQEKFEDWAKKVSAVDGVESVEATVDGENTFTAENGKVKEN